MNAAEAFHFKIVSQQKELTLEDGLFFAPKFLYWLCGEEEKVRGYQGLQVVIYLSSKQLVPCVEIAYQ